MPGAPNYFGDVFVHDRDTGETSQVSVSSDGEPGNRSSGWPSISADGRYVAFHSRASNLAPGVTNDDHDVFVHDRETGQTSRVSVSSDGEQGNYWSAWPSISADGRYVAFSSVATTLVTQEVSDWWESVYVHDRDSGHTSLVSVNNDGEPFSGPSLFPSISGDGRYVAFHQGNHVLVRDREAVDQD